MDDESSLSLFGVIHMDTVGKVTDELDAYAEDTDAIFIEYPADPGSLRTYLEVLLRAPAFLLGLALVMLFVQGPPLLVLSRDLLSSEYLATQHVSKQRNLPVHAVDEHPIQRAQRCGPKIVLLNWALVAPVVAYEPLLAGATATALLGGALIPALLRRLGRRYVGPALLPVGMAAVVALLVYGYISELLLLASAVGFAVHLRTGIDPRNRTMLDRVADTIDEEGYEDAVLVTGKGHLGGLVRDAAERAITVPRVHVSFWRDTGTTYHAPFPDGLPEIGGGDTSISDRFGAFVHEELPGHARRYGASVVDALVVVVLFAVVLFLSNSLFDAIAGTQSESTPWQLWLGIWAVVPTAYHALLEANTGTTVGKRLAGLSVTGTDGSALSPRKALRRNLFRPVDLATGYILSGASTFGTARNQSLGDVFARTVVRRAQPDARRARKHVQDGTRVEGDQHVPERPSSVDRTGDRSVVSEADLPGYPRRYAAALADAVSTLVLWFTVTVVFLGFYGAFTGNALESVVGFVMLGAWATVPIGYHAVLEGLWGKTAGKRLAGLAVTATDGNDRSWRAAVLRNALRPVDFLLLYLPSGVATLATTRKRSVGDLLGGTVVRHNEDVLLARAREHKESHSPPPETPEQEPTAVDGSNASHVPDAEEDNSTTERPSGTSEEAQSETDVPDPKQN